jgi:hypothetical protein
LTSSSSSAPDAVAVALSTPRYKLNHGLPFSALHFAQDN